MRLRKGYWIRVSSEIVKRKRERERERKGRGVGRKGIVLYPFSSIKREVASDPL